MHKDFIFKKFSIWRPESVFPVTTDSVLLGSWCSCLSANKALDIGTGSGLLCLMLVQRNAEVKAIGIDVHKESVQCASENFKKSAWTDRLKVLQLDLKKLVHEFGTIAGCQPIDLMVCNPPYFKGQLPSINLEKKRSRHAMTFDFYTLFQSAKILLAEEGRLALVVPANQESLVTLEAIKAEFYLLRSLFIYHNKAAACSLVLLEYSKRFSPLQNERLILFTDKGEKTTSYLQLTDTFYL